MTASRARIGGVAAHAASRVMALGEASEVNVSSTTRSLVDDSGTRFETRGLRSRKGLPAFLNPGISRGALANALGDPSLELLIWSADEAIFEAADGTRTRWIPTRWQEPQAWTARRP